MLSIPLTKMLLPRNTLSPQIRLTTTYTANAKKTTLTIGSNRKASRGGHLGSADGIMINSGIESFKTGTTGFLPSLSSIELKGISKFFTSSS